MAQETTKASMQPQYTVKQLKNVHIPMPDGIHLSADLFLPDGEGQFPCVLNYIPYRKQDASAYTGMICNDFASHGFASAIVDIRGTGESGGITLDEYTLQEQQDGCEVIDWLSHKPWCNGNVGMWGASYSGFNSIQIAMHAPEALKAIVPMFATDDRYNDDVHYYGGCLIGVEQVLYPAMMVTMNATPPYRETAGVDWAKMWKERLDGNQPWILNWFQHQVEDDYWKPGSLKTDYASIKCPVYNIGGWADGYTNPVFRMQQHLQVPHKAMVGPWLHNAPSSGIPGPNVDFLREMRRWWTQWLKGEETGIMQEPKLAVYIQQGEEPTPYEAYMPGAWRFLDKWPPDETDEQAFYLAHPGILTEVAGKEEGFDGYRYQATVGATAGVWCAVSGIDGLTRDQSADEGRSLTYTSRILEEPLEILGSPKAILYAASTAEVAFFCVKISDINPDGTSRLVCRGILNATHRNSHAYPEPVHPGEIMELEIPLKFISWTFQANHRIRVSVSSSDWPWVWPSPYSAVNRIYLGTNHRSRVLLPVMKEPKPSASDFHFQEIPNPYSGRSHGESVFGTQPTWMFTHDIVNGYSVLHVGNQGQGQIPGTGITFLSDSRAEFGSSDEKPEATFAKGLCKSSIIECDGKTEISGRTSIRSTTSNFFIDIELKVEKDGEPFFDRTWSEVFPRNFL